MWLGRVTAYLQRVETDEKLLAAGVNMKSLQFALMLKKYAFD